MGNERRRKIKGQCEEQGCRVRCGRGGCGESKCGQWDEQCNECNEQLRQAFSEIVRGGGNLKIFS